MAGYFIDTYTSAKKRPSKFQTFKVFCGTILRVNLRELVTHVAQEMVCASAQKIPMPVPAKISAKKHRHGTGGLNFLPLS